MARFLLDEQISPRVAEEARQLGLDVVAVAGSPPAGRDDAEIFRQAIRQGRIVVTYDVSDFSGFYGDLMSEGLEIPGLVFVDHRTIPTSDIGGLARALAKLARSIEKGQVIPSAGIYLHR